MVRRKQEERRRQRDRSRPERRGQRREANARPERREAQARAGGSVDADFHSNNSYAWANPAHRYDQRPAYPYDPQYLPAAYQPWGQGFQWNQDNAWSTYQRTHLQQFQEPPPRPRSPSPSSSLSSSSSTSTEESVDMGDLGEYFTRQFST